MQPRPNAETSKPLLPKALFFMTASRGWLNRIAASRWLARLT
jgi:hypothetical protein